MYRVVILVLFTLISATASLSNAGPLIPRSEIFADADKRLVRLSTDGKYVSYISDFDGKSNLFLKPFAGKGAAEPFFDADDGSISSYVWLYTGRHIVYTAVLPGPRFGLFVVDTVSQKKKEITPGPSGFTTILKVSPYSPEEVLVAYGHSFGDGDVLRINALTGSKSLVVKQDSRFGRYLFDNSLNPVIAQSSTSNGGSVLHRKQPQGSWEPFLEIDAAFTRESRAHSVDRKGKTLYLVDNRTTDKAVLKAVTIASGKKRIIARDPDADLVRVPMVNPITGKAESATAYFGALRRHYIDKSIKRDFDHLSKVRGGDVGVAGRSSDDKKWLVVYMDGGPMRFYSYERASGNVEFLFTDHGVLEKYQLAKRSSVVIKTRDGLKFPAQVFLPPNKSLGKDNTTKKPLPMLVYVHGGPFVAYPWNSWYTNRTFQLLANRGYAVMRVEFRGAGGFGKKMIEAGNLEWGGKMDEDVEDAVEWAISKGITTRSRVGIYGWSYGGYATLSALAFAPDKYACGFALYPVSDLNVLAQWSDLMRRKLGDPSTEKGKAHLKKTSPLFHVGRIKRPLLITHGGRDNRAIPSHSDRLVEAMKKAEKPITYLYYPAEAHDYREPENWESLFAVAERFFSEHLGGLYEPVGTELDGKGYEIKAGAKLIPGLGSAVRNADSASQTN